MGRFSKADIQFHSESYGREAHAAVNVKVYDWREPDLAAVARDAGASAAEAEDFASWYQALPEAKRCQWADLAVDFGWDSLSGEAVNAGFPTTATVYAEGRSSGWAILATGDNPYGFTREDVAGWDAIAVARFARFARYCRETVADLPYQAASLAYINAFEPAREARERSRRFSFFYDVPWPVVSGGAA